MRRRGFVVAALMAAAATPVRAAETMTVRPVNVTDEKAVFATVESANVVPARARIGGTVAGLSVRAGDPVRPGQVIAVVAVNAAWNRKCPGTMPIRVNGIGVRMTNGSLKLPNR